jgi:predicted phage terminase large subunit-like protein
MDFRDLLRARPLVAAHLKKDFGAFCRGAWPILHRGSKLNWTPAHDLICEHLVAVYRGDLTRLVVNCPPRFGKSSVVTILFPIWCWLQNPTLDFLCCSYEIDLATNHNLDRRRLMDSKWFRDLFGDRFELATERSQAGEFSNDRGGTMQAASVNSKAQGRGGHVAIVDDPLSADMSFSETFRNEVNAWFVHQLPQRLNDPATSAIILVMQRLHQNDPTGVLLAQEDSEWTLLKLALIAESDETRTFPISGRIWRRKKGDCLDPKRWPPKVVTERQRNRLVFAGQFQQEPAPVEGNLIRVDDILFYGGRDPQSGALDGTLPERFDRKIISVDCSFKTTFGSDFVALIVVGVLGARRYVLHVTNARLDLTGTLNEIRNAHAAFSPISATLVEAAANGHAVISALKDQIAGLVAVDPQGSKMSRVVAASPEFVARNWYIERHGAWAHKIIEQLTMFPNARNDDITDAISQTAVWLQANTYELGLLDYFKTLVTGKRRMPRSVEEIQRRVPAKAQRSATPGTAAVRSCAHCGSPRIHKIGNGPEGDVFHCYACGKHSDPSMFAKGEACEGCGSTATPQVIAGGMRRCSGCGLQTWPEGAHPPKVAAFNRRDAFDDRWDRGMFGRFG